MGYALIVKIVWGAFGLGLMQNLVNPIPALSGEDFGLKWRVNFRCLLDAGQTLFV